MLASAGAPTSPHNSEFRAFKLLEMPLGPAFNFVVCGAFIVNATAQQRFRFFQHVSCVERPLEFQHVAEFRAASTVTQIS